MQKNPVYRYHKLWLAIGYILIAVVVYFSVVTTLSNLGLEVQHLVKSVAIQYFDKRSSLWLYFDKWTHLLAYFVLMIWFAQIYHVKKQRFIYALSFVFMGVSLEFVQSFGHARTLEFFDMLANSLGVLIALVITKVSTFRRILLRIESYI